jgi:DtxR family transcriptional regulator, Mn-dependent transcriptional regulator
MPPAPDRHSAAVEDYLKVVYVLGEHGGEVTTSSVAERMGVAASSVSSMVRRLRELGLVSHARYGDIALTDAGRRVALTVVRRHRLIEQLLVTDFGYAWDEVHDEAEVLEHAVSDRLLERIAEHLGHPTVDPHGDPIPGREGEVRAWEAQRLSGLGPGAAGLLVRVDDDAEVLRHLTQHEIALGAHLRLVRREPFGGPFVVAVGHPPAERTVHFGPELVASLWVRAEG